MTLDEYFGDWLKVIDKTELISVIHKVGQEYKKKLICPAQTDVFKVFKLCHLNNLKTIMLFQDPYPQKGVATGIALANKSEISEENLSPSLKVVKEAVLNLEIPHNFSTFDPTLESWAKQGVLLLNSALTVEMNKAGSHTMLWRPFIATLLKNLSKYNTGIVYVLFGKQAQTFKPYINKKFNYLFEIDHPAYYARIHKKMPKELFTNINKIVKGIYGEPIEWYNEESINY